MALDDRVAVVTGGAQGIGQGIALRLAAAGARIAVLDRQPATQTPPRGRELGRPAWGGQVDVADAAGGPRADGRLDDEIGRPHAPGTAAGVVSGTGVLVNAVP